MLRAWMVGAAALVAPLTAHAGSGFDDVRTAVFGERAIASGQGFMTLKVPSRPEDIRAMPIDVSADFRDGRTIRAVTIIVDNNPSPVAAAFTLGAGRAHVGLGLKVRFNQQSDVRAVVEASDGALYMVSQLVKFPGGQAACSAPPSTPADIAAANLGRMELAALDGPTAASAVEPRVRLDLSHPNHTGMVLDQITLLYTPLRMIEAMTVRQGDELVFEMEGSIALNENPSVTFDYRRNGAPAMTVVAHDTDGATFTKAFPLGAGS